MNISIPGKFAENMAANLSKVVGKPVNSDWIKPLIEEFIGEVPDRSEIDVPPLKASEDAFNVWCKTIELLVAGDLEKAQLMTTAFPYDRPAHDFLRGLILLDMGSHSADAALMTAVKADPNLLAALMNLGSIDLKAKPITSTSNHIDPARSLVAKALSQSGIDPDRHLRKPIPKPIMSIAQAIATPPSDPFGVSHWGDEYAMSIAYLQRPDLKGRAYRLIVGSDARLPDGFMPYLDKSASDRTTGKVTCFLDGMTRKRMDRHLIMKYNITTDVYCAFFDVSPKDITAYGFHPDDDNYQGRR